MVAEPGLAFSNFRFHFLFSKPHFQKFRPGISRGVGRKILGRKCDRGGRTISGINFEGGLPKKSWLRARNGRLRPSTAVDGRHCICPENSGRNCSLPSVALSVRIFPTHPSRNFCPKLFAHPCHIFYPECFGPPPSKFQARISGSAVLRKESETDNWRKPTRVLQPSTRRSRVFRGPQTQRPIRG